MILQSLYALYERLQDDPAYGIAPPGYSLQKISFRVVLRPDGSLFEIQRVQKPDGKPEQKRVLGETKPSGSALNPRFLWDNTGYMLGYKPGDDKPKRTRETFDAFRKQHLAQEKDIGSPSFSAVCRFLEKWSPDEAAKHPILEEIKSGFGLFQIVGETSYVHEDPTIDDWWKKKQQAAEEQVTSRGQCLLTGKWDNIARLQPMIKGVAYANAQAALVGFNDAAYESYGKKQSLNAPVSENAATAYGAALNALLDGPMKSKHRIRLADATVAFWTDRPSVAEDIFAQFADHGSAVQLAEEAQDEALLSKLEVFLNALRQGVEKYGDVDENAERTRFYMLGLSPNRGRISVRFFLQGTVRELLDSLGKHYRDMRIERQYGDNAKRPEPEFPPAWMLLRQTARDSDDIPPVLAGPLLRAVITGTRYPDGLYTAVLRRIHADRQINYLRACIIKGYLVRNQGKEVSMSLDKDREEPAYLVGRLFAALEKTQFDALGEVGANIRDRFYGAASATPQSVFPRLLRTYQHHLPKMEIGRVGREILVRNIVDRLNGFPAHLGLPEQGLFAIGYYHQMKDLWTSKKDKEPQTNKEE
jgi:CRISPR-associated protein Csd1